MENRLLETKIVAVSFSDISVVYARWGDEMRALNHVTLGLCAGEWTILVGPNGSGKSTLLNVINQRVCQSSGCISVFGTDVTRISAAELSRLSFTVSQDPLAGTAPDLTVFENLALADSSLRGKRWSRRDMEQRYSQMLSDIGLHFSPHQMVRDLSGGERQILTILMADLMSCSIVLMDEPLAALDPRRKEMALTVINRLHNDGRTLVTVTHDIDFACTAGDRTIALRDGRVVYDEHKNNRDRESLRTVW